MTTTLHTSTIVKCRVTNNQRLLTVIQKYPDYDGLEVGHTFTSTKVDAQIGDIVYVNIRVHESRIHTISHQVADQPGRLKTIFETEIAVQGKKLNPEAEAEGELTAKKISSAWAAGSANPETSYFYVSHQLAEIFGIAAKSLDNNPERAIKVLIAGGSGYGKTSIAQRFAEIRKVKSLRMNCASIRDPEEWFGHRVAEDGTTKFMPSHFIETVSEGNCVIILDEFNRLEPWLTNTIYPLLDHDQKTTIYNQEYKVGPNVLFVATINIGFQFAGTFTIDEALSNRFDLIGRVEPMPQREEIIVLKTKTGISEKDASSIVALANRVRSREELSVPFSTRTTLQIANAVVAGSSVRSAIEHTVLANTYLVNNDKLRKSLLDIVNGLFGTYSPVNELLFDFNS